MLCMVSLKQKGGSHELDEPNPPPLPTVLGLILLYRGNFWLLDVVILILCMSQIF